MPRRFCRSLFAAALQAFCMVLTSTMWAQNPTGPQPVLVPSAVPAPVDHPYAGTISLSVDLTNVNDRVLNVREAIPVRPGDLKQHRRRLSGEAARKHGLNQKDFKSATTQAAPVTSKVRTHSDQLKCAFG